MNILITGSHGFVGKSLTNHLGKNYSVFGLGRSKKNKINAKNEFEVNLLDKADIEDFLKQVKKNGLRDWQTIIHCAGVPASQNPIKDGIVLKNNNHINEHVADLARELSPSVFINLSSMSVYPYEDGNFSEESKCEPFKNSDFYYGLSKLNGEMILSNALAETTSRLVNLRVAQVYGEGMRADRIIPVMLNELKKENKITVFGEGERKTNFIEIRDLCKVIEYFLTSSNEGTYNVGKENISLLELATRLRKSKGNKDSSVNLVKEGKREKFILDTSKLRKLIEI